MRKLTGILLTAIGSVTIYEALKRYGILDQAAGKAQKTYGKATNDPGDQAKGMFKEVKGNIKGAFSETKDAIQDAVEDFTN